MSVAEPDRTTLGERARRLESYRRHAGRPATRAVPPWDARPATLALPSRDAPPGVTMDASRLANALGGEVERSAAGRLVRVRESLTLPLDARRLASLPFPLDPTAPLCCLDTETTGLATASGTFAFMVGLGHWEGERFTVEQLVLPDQPDEPALLDALRRALPPDPWLVTYNGRSFDWPLIEARFRLQRDQVPEVAGHLDLLPIARRLWRHRLPDARLATVESGVAGIRRQRDLPGALVPARYLAYLRTGQPAGLRAVAEHNRADIVSLARLLVHLAEQVADPRARAAAHPGDTAALARAYARRGRFDEAIACVDVALRRVDRVALRPPAEGRRGSGPADDPPAQGPADEPPTPGLPADRRPAPGSLAVERARLLRRAGRLDEASRAWRVIAAEGGALAPLAWIELAKEREHRLGDPAGALAAVERAAQLIERARICGVAHPALERDLARRRHRLRQRLKRRAA